MKGFFEANGAAMAIAFFAGMVATIFILGEDDALVTIHGTKDTVQTVEWHDKNYRLVPLDARP